jgi:hypothetical protein
MKPIDNASMAQGWISLLLFVLGICSTAGFVAQVPTGLLFGLATPSSLPLTRDAHQAVGGDWIALTDDGAVKKRILREGDGELISNGSEVEVEYVGTLESLENWGVDDVIDCWLKNLQGLDHLADAFQEAKIDGSKLMDTHFFTEDFVAGTLGVSNKIQCKKLVMAAKRLSSQRDEFPAGTEFDSSKERGPFKFVVGQGKAIQAYEIAVPTMRKGEVAEVVCRADYAYKNEGYRKRTGEVVVPPFATLRFRLKILDVST